jgi:hypothetical protein
MLPTQAVSYAQLRREGLSEEEIFAMGASLKIFPTPFKGIYYVPLAEERRGRFIERPLRVLFAALKLYLGTNELYLSCETAEEFLGLKWTPTGEVHVVNAVRSGRIDLQKRIDKNKNKGTYRAKKIAHLLSYYGKEIVFHKVASVKGAKVRETPYGRFAMKSQIKADKKRFREEKPRGKKHISDTRFNKLLEENLKKDKNLLARLQYL